MKRIIFLVDMNAFFIGCEMSRQHNLKGKPAAVAGDPKFRAGIILAANYDARKYGVKTTMQVHEARKLCPGLVLVPPDHSFYEKKSREVMDILGRYSPVIEQNSIDEAWMDLTGCEKLFGAPLDIAKSIMKDIMDELDLWCSVGIAGNKFLSKMASDLKKPLGITEVWEEDIPLKIWPLPVREMYGIGKQTEKKLSKLSIFTIGDLAKCDKSIIVKNFGKSGEDMHRLANGIDPTPVAADPRVENKSVSRSTTLPVDIVDLEHAKTVILKLSEEVGADARRYGCKAKTVTIVIRYNDFQTITRQKSIAPTYLTTEIYNTGVELLEENWNRRPVRLLGIGLGNFLHKDSEQVSIFDLVELVKDDKQCKMEKLDKTIDNIRERFGSDKIKRAKTIDGA